MVLVFLAFATPLQWQWAGDFSLVAVAFRSVRRFLIVFCIKKTLRKKQATQRIRARRPPPDLSQAPKFKLFHRRGVSRIEKVSTTLCEKQKKNDSHVAWRSCFQLLQHP